MEGRVPELFVSGGPLRWPHRASGPAGCFVRLRIASRGFQSEEGPGPSVFYKDEGGQVFHTYSTYARGLDMFIGAYHFLDVAPKGRNEEGLKHGMAWVRHHDKY